MEDSGDAHTWKGGREENVGDYNNCIHPLYITTSKTSASKKLVPTVFGILVTTC